MQNELTATEKKAYADKANAAYQSFLSHRQNSKLYGRYDEGRSFKAMAACKQNYLNACTKGGFKNITEALTFRRNNK
jgi:hypothetical protein